MDVSTFHVRVTFFGHKVKKPQFLPCTTITKEQNAISTGRDQKWKKSKSFDECSSERGCDDIQIFWILLYDEFVPKSENESVGNEISDSWSCALLWPPVFLGFLIYCGDDMLS